jgi:DNA topoisomerase-1
VNDSHRSISHRDITAKDVRTWGGTVVATETLADLGPAATDRDIEHNIVVAVDAAAEALRNTRTVCRNCYVHPRVPETYREGDLQEAWKRARASTRFSRAERTVLTVLDK